jgi:hypothetical protein
MRVHAGSTPPGQLDERYRALLDLGRVLTGLVRPDDLYRALGDRIGAALGAEGVLVSSYDRAADRAAIAHATGGLPVGAGQTSYRGSECMAIREGRPVAHLPGEPTAASAAAGLPATHRPALVAPILREGHVLGTITVLGRENTLYDTTDLDFVTAIANLVATRALPSSGPAAASGGRVDEITRAIAAVALPDALTQVGRSAQEATGADGVVIWLLRSGGVVEAAFSTGGIAPRKGTAVSLSHELFRGLAERRDPVMVCLLGESTAAGWFHAPAMTPARMLQYQLDALRGEHLFEVIDLTMVNLQPASLVQLAAGAMQLSPDALIVFAGNNWPMRLPSFPGVSLADIREGVAAVAEHGVAGLAQMAHERTLASARNTLETLGHITATTGVPLILVVPEVNLGDWSRRRPVPWLPGDCSSR